MATNIAKLTAEKLSLKGELDERMPAITSGLVSFYPLDSAAGTFDKIGGYQPIQHTCSGANLIEAMALNWRDPASWQKATGTGSVSWDETKQALKFTGHFEGYLKTRIWVDYTKHYAVKVTYMQESQSTTNYLYIGGFSALASGASFNGGGWDYSLVGAAKPTLGTWITASITRFGTGAYPSGWTGSQGLAVWHKFGGLFNYNCQNTTDVVYIKDISIVVTDADTSNCGYSNYGTSVDVGTTNLWTTTTPGIYNNYAVPASLTTLPNETFLGRPIWRVSHTPTAESLTSFQQNFHSHGIYGGGRTFLANTAYAVSIFWRCVNKPDIQVGLTASNIGGWYDLGTYDIGNGWKRSVAYRNGTVTTDKTDQCYLSFRCPSAVVGEPIVMDWSAPMIEQGKMWAGGFRVGTTSLSSLTLPFALTPPYTIQFKHRPMKSYAESLPSQAVSPKIMQLGTYYGNSSVSLWNHTGNLRAFIKGDTAAGWTATGIYTAYSASTWDHIEHDYAIVAESSTVFKFYMDGSLVGTLTSTEAVTAISKIDVADSVSAPSCALYRNLAIYNRALSALEVKKNANPVLEVRSAGDISSVVIKESPVVPADAYHYPLHLDGNDRFGKYAPYLSQDVVYGKDGAWVGTAATNLLYDSEVFNGSFSYTTATTIEQNYRFRLTQGMYNTTRLVVPLSKLTNAANYNLSFKMKRLNGTGANFYLNDWCDVPLSNYRLEQLGDGVWFNSGYASRTTYDNTYSFFDCNNTSADIVDIYDLMVANKVFAAPFTNGTRGASNLSYNFNSSIGLDWNGDWSIVYFKKPIATYNDTFTGYCIESIGCNSNSVGGGYQWFGKIIGSDYEYLGGIGNVQAITQANYFNKEHMVSLIKSGTTVTYTVWGIAGLVSSASYTLGTCSSNYYVTQYGYDLKLGGWDNGNPPNAYYRDLVVAKRAFTSTELNALYRNHLKQKKSQIILRSLSERCVL